MSKQRLWDCLKVAGGGVFLSIVGYAGSFMLAKAVGSIPNRPYKITVLENDGGTPRYDFILFEVLDSGIELKMPRLKSHGMATPDKYAKDTAGFISYEIKDGKGEVRGYVLASATSTVRIWADSGGNGKLAVEVQSRGGGGRGGGGSGGSGGGGGGSGGGGSG